VRHDWRVLRRLQAGEAGPIIGGPGAVQFRNAHGPLFNSMTTREAIKKWCWCGIRATIDFAMAIVVLQAFVLFPKLCWQHALIVSMAYWGGSFIRRVVEEIP